MRTREQRKTNLRARGMDYGSMTEREAIDLLNIIYDALEDEWSDNTILARYLEAIDHAQDALRDQENDTA